MVDYRRKQTVINPTTVFDLTGEWVTSTIDDISDLGSHSTPLEINDFDENSFSFFPNPVKSNQIFFKFTSELKVEIYDITGKLIINTLLKDRTTKSLDVSTLNSGLYVVKMSNNFGVQVKKLICQ